MLSRFFQTWTTWIMVILVMSAVNLAFAGFLGSVLGLSCYEIAALYFAFMMVWLFVGFYRSRKYIRGYRKMLEMFQGQVERGEE